jgi:hypothetical protein
MGWLYGVIGVVAIYAAHRLSCWAEDRGWIYYRKKSGRSGMAASAFLEIHSMMEPSKKHVLEVMREDEDQF